MTRIGRAWAALGRDQRLAAAAALALFLTMFLPWYQQNAVVSADRRQPLVSQNLNAFAVFSFIEAAVLLVAAATLALLFARGERRSFHLPGSDGTIVMLAGAWTALLLVLRLFDKPGITSHGVAANVGIQWGIFFALGAAGLLIYAGSRMRAGQRPEPPLLRGERRRARPGGSPPAPGGSEDLTAERTEPRRALRAHEATTVLAGGGREPRREGPEAVPARPRFPPPPRPAAAGPPPPSTAGGRALQRRRRAPGQSGEQLSLEESGPEPPTDGV